MKHSLFSSTSLGGAALVLGLVLAAVGAVGCNPVVPVSPTWKDDVRPLLLARCLRCHNGEPNIDPKTTPAVAATAFNFDYDEVATPIQPGLLVLQGLVGKAIRGQGLRRMPPPPAEALEDWQIEMLENWAVHPR